MNIRISELSEYCKNNNINFRLMFQDEAGFGRINKPKMCWCVKGLRPLVPCHRIREYVYAYGAISPLDGQMVSLELPRCDSLCMNVFLEEVSNTYPNDYIMMVADNASWHKSNGLVIPNNIEIFPLLPYTPELNPIEMIWDEIREKFFRNELFASLNAVSDRLCTALKFLMDNPYIVKSISSWDWILTSFLNNN